MRTLEKTESIDPQRKGGVQVEIHEDFKEYSLDNLECHEAGFDALMTGYSFLKAVTYLSKFFSMKIRVTWRS